jgi:hypothetical protein
MNTVWEIIGLAVLLAAALVWIIRLNRRPVCSEITGPRGCGNCPIKSECAGIIVVEPDDEPAPRGSA